MSLCQKVLEDAVEWRGGGGGVKHGTDRREDYGGGPGGVGKGRNGRA